MEITAIIAGIIIIFIYLIVQSIIVKEELCSQCGKSNTTEYKRIADEFNNPMLPKAKGPGLNVLYNIKCQNCGHIWTRIREEEY